MFTAAKVTVSHPVKSSSYGVKNVFLTPEQDAVVILAGLPNDSHVVQFYKWGRAYRAIVSSKDIATINGKKVAVEEEE